MENIKVKIITGFRKDQQYSIDGKEAHKAYWLFNNPSERGTFDNGLAIIGKSIERIEPDYHGTMGWNPDHILDGDDWNDIDSKGIKEKTQKILAAANVISKSLQSTDQLKIPLYDLLHLAPSKNDELSEASKLLADKMSI